jgi:hypothetical protein
MATIDQALKGVLATLGFTLEDSQPHISGERFLMSPEKLVLLGRTQAGERVVIKVSTTQNGIREIEQEKKVRDMLRTVPFAGDQLLMSKEIYFGTSGAYTIFVTQFIEQEKIFVSYPIEEQFFLALRAFEAQEAFHATTYEHMKQVRTIFKTTSSSEYITQFVEFKAEILKNIADARLQSALTKGAEVLRANEEVLSRYSNYLTHTDFVPHNLRVHNRQIYLLDQTAIGFANKYEGWARFLNYMLVHNPELERLLKAHVLKNRGKDEYLDLQLMRIFKMGFLLRYYTRALAQTEGSLNELMKERVTLWAEALEMALAGTEVPIERIEAYKKKRDMLRSPEEKERQREAGIA